MLIFYLLCYAPVLKFFHLLCSILCSCKRFVLKNLVVLLEYIHLHHKNFNVITVLSEVLHTNSCTNNNHIGCSIGVY